MGVIFNGEEFSGLFIGGIEYTGLFIDGVQYLPIGTAMRVGNAVWRTDFTPGGLASLSGNLYVIGTTGRPTSGPRSISLFQVNTASGALGTSIPLSDDLRHVIPDLPQPVRRNFGFTEHGGSLYFVWEDEEFYSVTINPTTQIGEVAARRDLSGLFDTGDEVLTSMVSHNNVLYVTFNRPFISAGQPARSVLYSVDLATSAATFIGVLGRANIDPNRVNIIDEAMPQALASHEGRMYMAGEGERVLMLVDPTNAVTTRVGPAVNFGANLMQPTGMTSHGGELYMVDAGTKAIYTVTTI